MPQVVQRRLRAFVAQGSGIPPELVIPGNDEGRRPPEPYASVLVVTDGLEGAALERYRAALGDSESTVIDAVTNHRALVSVQFYREATETRLGAHDSARLFINWIDTETGKQAADRAGFRLDGLIQARQIDEIISDHFEERANVDLTILYRYRDPASQDVGTIENVEIVVKGPAESQREVIRHES